MSLAYLHSDNMEIVRERLENTIEQSSVEIMYDEEYCFITVTQRNETTGNESKWLFCVDFGDWTVTMLEPTEDIEGFTFDNEIFRIIKNFLNGGMSREKRMNRPDYDSGEPIKITGKGNKIGSSKKPIKSDYSDEEYWYPETKKVYRLYKYNSNGDYYTWDYDTLEEAQRMKPRGNRYTSYNIKEVEVPVQSSRKSIKSSLSDVNKALGFTDNDVEEDGRIHITTDFGEFVVDYVNDEYIVTYDGEERTFTEYKDTVKEVVDLFNQLCNEEIKLFNENINSSKSIKSNYSNKEVVVKILDSSDYEARNVLESYGGQLDYDIWSISKENIQDVKDEINDWKNRIVFYSSYNYRSGRFGKKLTESAVKYTNCKSIKSSKSVCIGFNTENGTLLWKRDDLYTLDGSSIRQTKRKDIADKWIEKYNLNTTDTERLDKYTQEGIGQIPWGIPLVEDKDQTNYNKKLASILPPHNLNSSYGNNPLPTERDYRDFVDKLNNYCKNMKFSYGPMYEFEYEPEEGMSNDGWGHEYPNFRIYDTQGNLDMFSDDSIVKYIRNELKKKGWYPEAVHSSSDFTIAVE